MLWKQVEVFETYGTVEEKNPDYRRKLFAILNQDTRLRDQICEGGMQIVKKKEQIVTKQEQPPILKSQPIDQIDSPTDKVSILQDVMRNTNSIDSNDLRIPYSDGRLMPFKMSIKRYLTIIQSNFYELNAAIFILKGGANFFLF